MGEGGVKCLCGGKESCSKAHGRRTGVGRERGGERRNVTKVISVTSHTSWGLTARHLCSQVPQRSLWATSEPPTHTPHSGQGLWQLPCLADWVCSVVEKESCMNAFQDSFHLHLCVLLISLLWLGEDEIRPPWHHGDTSGWTQGVTSQLWYRFPGSLESLSCFLAKSRAGISIGPMAPD